MEKPLYGRFASSGRVTVISKALFSYSGSAVFYQFEPGGYVNTIEEKWAAAMQHHDNRFNKSFALLNKLNIEVCTFNDLVSEHGMPDYAKIDVEGHAATIVSFIDQPPRLRSLEFNLPEYEFELAIALVSIQRIYSDDVEFNLSVEYSSGLLFPGWVLLHFIKNEIDRRSLTYFELYVRTTKQI